MNILTNNERRPAIESTVHCRVCVILQQP